VDIVRGRIKRLEKLGVIIRYSTVIDYNKIGYEFYKTFVYLKNFNNLAFQKMNNYVRNSRVMINIVRRIASWDLELVLFVKSFAEYDKVIGDFIREFSGNIQKTESSAMSQDVIFPCRKIVLR